MKHIFISCYEGTSWVRLSSVNSFHVSQGLNKWYITLRDVKNTEVGWWKCYDTKEEAVKELEGLINYITNDNGTLND